VELTGVGQTALGAALMRAQESARADRLFEDSFAAAFVAEVPDLFAHEPDDADADVMAELEIAFGAHVALRTRFYDDYLQAASAGGCEQVVLLAAGLDARAYRLTWPTGTRLFELDLPDVLEFKARVLGSLRALPRCARTAVPIDLRGDWPDALVAAGFEPAERTAWLAEGLLSYVSNEDAMQLVNSVRERTSAGSQLSFDQAAIADDSLLTTAQRVPSMEPVTSLWEGGLEDAPAWLQRNGWNVTCHRRHEVAERYGRVVSGDFDTEFVVAIREA